MRAGICIALLFAIAACSTAPQGPPAQAPNIPTEKMPTAAPVEQMPAVQSEPLAQNNEAIDEAARLSSVLAKRDPQLTEFTALRELVASDDEASHLADEVVILVRLGEYEHAQHALGFLSSYLKTGKTVLCPGHALMHYYTFSKYGETALAVEQLEEAKEQLGEWIPAAREYNERYPSGLDFDVVVAHIRDDIARIDAGDSTVTPEEFAFLEKASSLCVEDAGNDAH